MDRDPRPVVVGVDGSPGSAGALRYGVDQARRRGAPLRLVHVLPSWPPLGPTIPLGPLMLVGATDLGPVGTSILDRAARTARELEPDLDVSAALGHGSRVTGLVEASRTAQLVVVGRETNRGIDRVLTGTTTAGVAARAACDVVVVPSSWSDEPSLGRVVAGVKTRWNARELLARAFAAAESRGAVLVVATAWELPEFYLDRIEARTHAPEWEDEGRRVLDELLMEERAAHPTVPVEIRVVHGHAADVLLHEGRGSDLLLLSRRRHALPPYGHLGGVPHALIRLSEVPVQVVPFVGDPGPEPLDELVLEEAGVPLK